MVKTKKYGEYITGFKILIRPIALTSYFG